MFIPSKHREMEAVKMSPLSYEEEMIHHFFLKIIYVYHFVLVLFCMTDRRYLVISSYDTVNPRVYRWLTSDLYSLAGLEPQELIQYFLNIFINLKICNSQWYEIYEYNEQKWHILSINGTTVIAPLYITRISIFLKIWILDSNPGPLGRRATSTYPLNTPHSWRISAFSPRVKIISDWLFKFPSSQKHQVGFEPRTAGSSADIYYPLNTPHSWGISAFSPRVKIIPD